MYDPIGEPTGRGQAQPDGIQSPELLREYSCSRISVSAVGGVIQRGQIAARSNLGEFSLDERGGAFRPFTDLLDSGSEFVHEVDFVHR